MGIGVSSWRIASSVARAGQLGVVSGTALDLVLARRLQDGDADGTTRRALAAFPVPQVAQRVLDRYFLPEGRTPGTPYSPIPRIALKPNRAVQELGILGAFVEVWLAKEGHDGLVGINLLEKIQMATPTVAYGAMLAGVDYVLMGAGIPREIPHLLDELAGHRTVHLPIDVAGGAPGEHTLQLDPHEILGDDLPAVRRPTFLAIVSAHQLAAYLVREESIKPDGFVVEGPRAGGHNAPPRGKLVLDETGQPVFGPRDDADIAQIAKLGLPFWLAGSQGTPEAMAAALEAGAAGVQVGTVFALCEETGFTDEVRDDMLSRLRAGTLEVRTDALASPTGFPFKVAQLPFTLSDKTVQDARPRLCDLGYLRTPYVREGGALGYRCKAEPVHTYVRKGGTEEDTVGRQCLCNALARNIGLGQTRADGYAEEVLVTLGSDLDGARRLAELYPGTWTARQAVDWIVAGASASAPSSVSADEPATAVPHLGDRLVRADESPEVELRIPA